MTRFELLRLEMRVVDELPTVRHLARRAALLIGMNVLDATQVATSLSEVGRAVQGSAGVQIAVEIEESAARLVIVVESDGAHELFCIGAPAHAVVARLMDRVDSTASRIRLNKTLANPVDESTLVHARDELRVEQSSGVGVLLESQDEELIAALLALGERDAELVSVNAELTQTNRGVLALYDELEQRATEVRAAHRIVFEELENTLRPPAPEVPRFELGVRYLPAQPGSPTGGDLYDWLVLPGGCLHIAVVDVRGHGVTSTRDALSVTHVLRTLTLEGHGLDDLVERADAVLGAAPNKIVATALVARFDPHTGAVQLTAAGHPPTLQVSADDTTAFLETGGRPIGYPFAPLSDVVTVQLSPGDCLLMYTDGLIEIRRDIVEGLDTLQRAARGTHGMSVTQLLDTVLTGCIQGDALRDDTLLLGVRWLPG